jgi:hypothetical protein
MDSEWIVKVLLNMAALLTVFFGTPVLYNPKSLTQRHKGREDHKEEGRKGYCSQS